MSRKKQDLLSERSDLTARARKEARPELGSPLTSLAERNTEPVNLFVPVIDCSSSMESFGPELAEAVPAFLAKLRGDERARNSVRTSFVCFNEEASSEPFCDVMEAKVPNFVFRPGTRVDKAITLVHAHLQEEVEVVRASGRDVSRAAILFLCDGHPTASILEAAQANRRMEEKHRWFNFFPTVVGNADVACLATLSRRKPKRLDEVKLSELFEWASQLMMRFSRSRPGDAPEVPPTDGWEVA